MVVMYCVICFPGEVAAYHREELDVQNQRSIEEPAKKFLELCLIHSMHLIDRKRSKL
ncbi:unnamed protein product [Brassica oleracea]